MYTDANFTVADDGSVKLAKLRPGKSAGPDNLLPRFQLEIVSTVPKEFIDKNIVPAD